MLARELDFKFIEEENIDEVVELMEKINDSINDSSIFSKDEKEDLLGLLKRGGAIVGAYDNDKLVAFRSLNVPKDDENLAYDVKNFDIDPDTVIINDSVGVLKEYRGMNLQNVTRDKVLKRYEDSKYTNKMSTISPTNPHSYMNTLESGYSIVALKKKYPDEKSPEGYDRFILLKSDDIKIEFTGNEEKISYEDTDKIKKVLADKYIGVSVDEDGLILFREVRVI